VRISHVIIAALLASASVVHADQPLTPFPSPMTPPSAAPIANAASLIFGTCATVNAVAYFSAAQTITCNATLTTDGVGGLLVGGNTTLGNASADTVTSNAASWTFPNLTTAAVTATPTDGQIGFAWSETLGAIVGATNSNHGFDFIVTSAGSAGSQLAMAIGFAAGYTGTRTATALEIDNIVNGTGNDLRLSTSFTEPLGNGGIAAFSAGLGAGCLTCLNFGGMDEAEGGLLNIARLAKATISAGGGGFPANPANSTNIGVASFALNTGGGTPIQIAGYFGLRNTTPTFASAALVADNGTTSSDIFVAIDGTTPTNVLTIKNGGNMEMGGDFNWIPTTDNTGKVGTGANRFAEVHAVTVTTGDLVMDSPEREAKWRLVEEKDRIVAVNENTGERFHVVMEAE